MIQHAYKILYHTENTYALPVKEACFMLGVHPYQSDRQMVMHPALHLNIEGSQWMAHNSFGTHIYFFKPEKPFTALDVQFSCEALVTEGNPFEEISAREQPDAWAYLQGEQARIEHYLFLRQTSLTRIPSVPAEAQAQPGQTIFDYLISLREWIYREFTFEAGVTHVHSTAHEAMDHRKGVCQDFAHIFTGLARRAGIPSRYVSGYLSQGMDYRGDSQLHAWSECWVPGAGWLGVDPSNNLLTDYHYIKIGHGQDYNDCAPMKGVLISEGEHVTSYRVSVEHMQQ